MADRLISSSAYPRLRASVFAGSELEPMIGRYRVGREIGRGGCAVVYEAEDTQLKRRVALKVVDARADREFAARLQREAKIAARLQHPNIVAVHEVGTNFIAMEFVDGGSLASALPSLTRDERLRMIEDTARAVACAHEQGVVHRDLKPQNVLVDRDGRVRLTDFGLARMESFETRLTRTNAVMGTPPYMAPEQVRGDAKAIDARTDVYALGAMLYEALTGRLPFDEPTPIALYDQVLNAEPAPPSRLDASVPRDIETVCLKALEKEPDRRYATAAEFADDVKRSRGGEPVSARPASVLYRVRRRLARRPALMAVAGGVLAVAATAGVLGRVVATERSRSLAELGRRTEQSLKAALLLRANDDLDGLRQFARETEAACREAIARMPDAAEPHFLLGRVCRALMREDEALAEQTRALELDPSHRGARYERVVLTAGLHRRRAEQLMALGGGAHLEADAEAKARREAMAADVALLGDDPAARGLLALAKGDRARGRELLSSAPGREEVRAALAAIATFDGAFEESVRLWTDAIETDKGFAMHRQGRGFARVAWGYAAAHRGEDPVPHYTAAIADLDAAIERAPGVSQAWTHRGLARFLWMDDLEHMGGDGAELYQRGLADFDRAIALRREESRAWLWRGILRSRRAAALGARGRDGGELQRAGLADVDEAVRLSGSADESRMWHGVLRAGWGFLEILRGADPGPLLDDALADLDGTPSWRAICRFARALRPGADAAGELARAIEDADAGVRASPESADAHARRGVVRLALDEDAVADFEAAIRRNGRRAESWVGLGRARAQRGIARIRSRQDPSDEFARALEAFAKAESLNRSSASVWQYRGQAREAWSVVKKDERAAAAREYEEAARLNPWLERGLRERIERLKKP